MNLFKNTYKIVEHPTLNGEKYFTIQYGWFIFKNYLSSDGFPWHDEAYAAKYGGRFKSIEDAKTLIKTHAEKLLDERISKSMTKTIARI